MTSYTFNKGNWSGQSITVELLDNNRFEIYNNTFEYVKRTLDFKDNGPIINSYDIYEVNKDGKRGDLVVQSNQLSTNEWMAFEVGGDLTRSNPNGLIAAMQVILNIY